MKNSGQNKKAFVVFNTACFGDVILCNCLCQNIKNKFPDSHVIFVCDKPYKDVALYQKDVDEVVAYDKKGLNKGNMGLVKFILDFIKNHKSLDIYASFITYSNFRNYIIAKMIGSKYVINENNDDIGLMPQLRHANLFKKLSDNIVNYPIRYILPDDMSFDFGLPDEYVAFCPVSKDTSKDIPISDAIKILTEISQRTGLQVVIVGVGAKVQEYAGELKKANCEFVDLINKTTIPQLAYVLKKSKGLVTVDTGTMHLGCALDIPLYVFWYEKEKFKIWFPCRDLYKSNLISDDENSTLSDNLCAMLKEQLATSRSE